MSVDNTAANGFNVCVQYNDPANASNFDHQNQGIRPVGVYSGGWVEVASPGTLIVRPFVAEVLAPSPDAEAVTDTFQVRVEQVSAGKYVEDVENNQYIVLRAEWSDIGKCIPELAAVNTPAAFDVVLAQYVGGSISYAARTVPATPRMLGFVEAVAGSSRVFAHGGRCGSGEPLKFNSAMMTVPSGQYLIYVTSGGAVAVKTFASGYGQVLNLAKVTSNGSSIVSVEDVRPFLTPSGAAVSVQEIASAIVPAPFFQDTLDVDIPIVPWFDLLVYTSGVSLASARLWARFSATAGGAFDDGAHYGYRISGDGGDKDSGATAILLSRGISANTSNIVHRLHFSNSNNEMKIGVGQYTGWADSGDKLQSVAGMWNVVPAQVRRVRIMVRKISGGQPSSVAGDIGKLGPLSRVSVLGLAS
jgi:hypothetical protein